MTKPPKLSEYEEGYQAGFDACKQFYRQETPTLRLGNLIFEASIQQLYYQGNLVRLTVTQRAIMEVLMTGRLITKEHLHTWLWPNDADKSRSLISSNLTNIKRRLMQAGSSENIFLNVFGVGWRLNPDN